MDHNEATNVITLLYKYFLKRAPQPVEETSWVQNLLDATRVSEVIECFGTCEEYVSLNRVIPFWPVGHYHSPIVDPNDDVRQYLSCQALRVGAQPFGIDISLIEMKEFVKENAQFCNEAKYPYSRDLHSRYYSQNGVFPVADALILRAVINAFRPRRVVEIGSGFSTACMLDTIDELELDTDIVCVDPHPERLISLLRPGDKVRIMASFVQNVSTDIFAELEPGDILFLDSTHVLKAASDVHYELFEVLPRLKPGVLIHFHDIPYPFEYPLKWIFDENYSWNEAYAVRALLMYSSVFKVFYSNSYLALHHRSFLETLFDQLPANPGTSLWIKKICDYAD